MVVIKVAVIGSHEFMQHLLSISYQVKDLEIVPYIYSDPQEAKDLIQQLKLCDVIFFSGALPYYFSKPWLEQLPVPSVYLQQDEMAVASSLLSIIYHHEVPFDRISIDLVDASFVKNVLNDIGMKHSPQVMDYKEMLPDHVNIAGIVDFHYSSFVAGETDLALTSVHAVYDKLQELKVPSKRMIDPTKSLIQGLEEAKSKARLAKSYSATVAACIVTFANEESISTTSLEEFARHVHGSFQKIDANSYILFTTRGDVETLIKTKTLDNFLKEGPFKLGFGYGMTAKEAEQHAKIAQNFAQTNTLDSSCYILSDEKELIGPIPKEKKVQNLKNDHPQLRKIAKEIKLSPANLSKIIQFSQSNPSLQFTASDLADFLQVTRRTAERILKKLVDHGYATICGEEMPYQQGRPRAIYELNLPIYF